MSVFLFPVVFTLIAIANRKDMAILIAVANWFSVAIYFTTETVESIIVAMAAINLAVAMAAISGHQKYRALSLTIMSMTLVGTALLLPLYLLAPWAGDALIAVQMVTAIALIRLDGRRELLNDMAVDCSDLFCAMRRAQDRANHYRR